VNIKNNRRCIITFRVSREEYALLKEAYEASNSRSLSDYAREAMMQKIAHSNRTGTKNDLEEIIERLQKLEQTIRRMAGDEKEEVPQVQAAAAKTN
jgi:hypothetical protein